MLSGYDCFNNKRFGNRRKVVSELAATMSVGSVFQEPDLQNILRKSYDYLTIMPKLRSTYDGRLIYKASYEERKVFLFYDSLAKL